MFERSVNNNFYEKHLPIKLYNYLNDHGLLNTEEHQISINVEGELKSITIKIEAVEGQSPFPSVVSITITTDSDETNELYNDKNWFGTKVIKDGLDYGSGNRKLFPLDGFSDRECRQKTNKKAIKLIKALDLILGIKSTEQKKESRCILC